MYFSFLTVLRQQEIRCGCRMNGAAAQCCAQGQVHVPYCLITADASRRVNGAAEGWLRRGVY